MSHAGLGNGKEEAPFSQKVQSPSLASKPGETAVHSLDLLSPSTHLWCGPITPCSVPMSPVSSSSSTGIYRPPVTCQVWACRFSRHPTKEAQTWCRAWGAWVTGASVLPRGGCTVCVRVRALPAPGPRSVSVTGEHPRGPWTEGVLQGWKLPGWPQYSPCLPLLSPRDTLALRCGPMGTQRGRHRSVSLPEGYVSCRSPARPITVVSPPKAPVSRSCSSCLPVLLAQETQLATCQDGWASLGGGRAAWLRPTGDLGDGCFWSDSGCCPEESVL